MLLHHGLGLVLLASVSYWSFTDAGAATAGTSRTERGALKVLYWATSGPGWRRTWDIQNEMSDPCIDNVRALRRVRVGTERCALNQALSPYLYLARQWYGVVCDRDGHVKSMYVGLPLLRLPVICPFDLLR